MPRQQTNRLKKFWESTELTKKDGNAFENARAKPNLAGGKPADFTSLSKEEFAKLGY